VSTTPNAVSTFTGIRKLASEKPKYLFIGLRREQADGEACHEF
jgi:hypothetical protein